jgi:hypothetical protein
VGVTLPTIVTVVRVEGEGVRVDNRGVEVEFTERVKGEVEVAEEEGLLPPAKEGVGLSTEAENRGVEVPLVKAVEVGKGLVGAVLCEPPPTFPATSAEEDTEREGKGDGEELVVT